MSSASATPADKFQPSWIRSTFHGPGSVAANSQRLSVNDEDANIEPSVAILAKNRYGREEVLQLQPKPIGAPFGLSNCPIFVSDSRGPTVMMQMSEVEQRLQMNINSSKAMSSLNPTDRTMVAGGGSPNGPNSPQIKNTKNEWTPVKSTSTWSRGAAVSAGGGLTATMNGGRGGLTRSLGRGTPLGQPEEMSASPYGQKYVPRGRGGTVVGRGTSTTAGSTQFNSRAQGLYDPRDPKDRPRNRLRSTSDDADPSAAPGQDENGGWTGSRFGRQNSSAWSKEENSWNQSSDREGSFNTAQKQENGGGNMPEWFEDADDGEKIQEPNAGSFDDDGRYRKEQQQQQATSAAAPRWRPGQQDQLQHHSTDEPNFPPHRYVPPEVLAAQPGAPRQVDFFYLDPTEVERGPFQKDQMYTWYQLSYFTDTLKVRTNEHTEWKTLGELKVLNGTAKPFDYKPSAPPTLQSSYSYPGNAAFGGNLFGGSSPWGEMFTPGQMYPGAPAGAAVAAAFDDKSMLAEKQRFEIQKMQEMQELMRVAQEQKRIAELKELEYRRQQEELRKKFDEEMLRKQMEQLELQKRLENLEAEKNARLQEERRRMEEDMKKAEEKRQKEQAELKRLEEEKRRLVEEAKKREIELRRKEEEIERKRHADRAAEEHRLLLTKKAEEDALRIRQAQAVVQAARREEEERKAAKDAERMFNNEDVRNTSKTSTPAESMESPWQTAPTKKSPPQKPKAAAWSCSAQSAPREKTLREIQDEEERQQLAEAHELARLRKEQESSTGGPSSSVQSALWSNANQRINWVGNTAPVVAKASGKPAWGGAGVDPKPAATSSISWDGPSLQAANKVAPTPAPVPKKAATAAPAKPAANFKTAPKTQAVDVFTQWVTKRLKEINKSVDADVLSSFLESVENPNEVEDYVQGYLGESKIAKEFVKEYLQKRCESRRRRDTGKDDLSCASYAGTGTGGTQGKRKKGKGARLVVDGSCLGFRATGDPNRVNQGEIETVPLPAGQKR